MAETTPVGANNPTSNPMIGTQLASRDNAEQIKTQFLSLLVAQLKNQDPLNPVENQDFVAQLAQFSSLEQLVTVNEGMDAFNDKLKYLNEGVDYIATLLTYTSDLSGIGWARDVEGAEADK
jgi:flagellar hook assembly protein FlgD